MCYIYLEPRGRFRRAKPEGSPGYRRVGIRKQFRLDPQSKVICSLLTPHRATSVPALAELKCRYVVRISVLRCCWLSNVIKNKQLTQKKNKVDTHNIYICAELSQPDSQTKASTVFYAVTRERHTSMSCRGSCSDAASGVVGGAGAEPPRLISSGSRPTLGATAFLLGRRARLLNLATEADLGQIDR